MVLLPAGVVVQGSEIQVQCLGQLLGPGQWVPQHLLRAVHEHGLWAEWAQQMVQHQTE